MTIALTVDLEHCLGFQPILKNHQFQCFVHWLFVHISAITPRDKRCDDDNTCCLYSVMARLNVYGSFGMMVDHYPLISPWIYTQCVCGVVLCGCGVVWGMVCVFVCVCVCVRVCVCGWVCGCMGVCGPTATNCRTQLFCRIIWNRDLVNNILFLLNKM